jgi:signal transduction histidine kinase
MSIRLRLALVFVAASAVLLSLGGWLFVATLSSSLLSSIDAQLASQAAQATRYLSPAARAGSASGVAGNPPEYLVQIVDAKGRVRAGSEEAGARPVLPPADLDRARHGRILVTQQIEGESERLLAQPLAQRPGWVTVVGTSLASYDSTISRVTRELAIGCSIFVVLAGAGAYILAMGALRPVERLRREVAAIPDRGGAPSPQTVRVPATRDEIAALAETMNDLLARLQRALQRERDLVADASHELRTPFTVLQGELELASRPGRSREELATAVQSAWQEVVRLTRLTEDLLLLARLDQHQLPLRIELADVPRLLTESATAGSARSAEVGVLCAVEAPPGLCARVDGGRIRQAIDNLVDNALRFAPAGSRIVLSARPDGQALVIDVLDEGPGFDPAFLPHAFERFRRADASRSRGDGGTGLGLAIVKGVVEAHGGEVTAANRPGGGASVQIRIPDAVTAATPEADTTPRAAGDARPAEEEATDRVSGAHEP